MLADSLFGPEGNRFVMYSAQHWAALACILLVLAAVHLCRETLRKPAAGKLFRYSLAALLLLLFILLQLWYKTSGSWTAAYSLPLQLSTIALLLSILLLYSRSYRIYEFIYFAGIASALQALLTPVLDVAFPHFWYFYFFAGHGGVVIAAWYFTIVEGFRPTLRSIGRTMLGLNALLLIVLPVNWATGGNYMFLARKPATPSLLDWLGPWPWYIAALELVALLFCFLLYAPFLLLGGKGRRQPE